MLFCLMIFKEQLLVEMGQCRSCCLAKKHAYAVVVRMRSRHLESLAKKHTEIGEDLDLMDQQQVLYLGDDESQAEDEAKKLVVRHAIQSTRDLSARSIYLIRTSFNQSVQEGILNEEVIWAWDASTSEILPGGFKQTYQNKHWKMPLA